MPKTKAGETRGHRQVGVRLSEETFASVEKHLEQMRTNTAPGVEVKLADAIRNLVALGLEAARSRAS